MKKRIFFISTNAMWSGSEELWSRAAAQLAAEGFDVVYSAGYSHHFELLTSARRIESHNQSLSLVKKVLRTLRIRTFSQRKSVEDQIQRLKPEAIIISQGNNIESLEVMDACRSMKVPYFTITQLVTEFHFLFIGDHNLKLLRDCYDSAVRNFFVSEHNKTLHHLMMGKNFTNSEVTFNPCKVKSSVLPIYPPQTKPLSLAMVGRIESFHKGYDLLFQVIEMQKWRERPLFFNLYGVGPHYKLISDIITGRQLDHVILKGQQEVTHIWSENHLLLMTSRMEGQALSLIEAMWCQRGAIVTKVGGASELVQDGVNGFLAEVNVESIDAALERAWAMRDQWEQIGIRAKETIVTEHPSDEVSFFCEKIRGML